MCKNFCVFVSITCLFGLLFMSSCNREAEEVDINPSIGRKVTAESEQFNNQDTKCYIDSNRKVYWNTGDVITVFDRSRYPLQYRFLGNTGDTYGDFEVASSGGASPYVGELGLVYACYPDIYEGMNVQPPTIPMTLPSRQELIEVVGDVNFVAPMVAVSDDYCLKFKNICGLLSLQLYGEEVDINSIRLVGHNNEVLSGSILVSINKGEQPSLSFVGENNNYVVLESSNPIHISSSEEECSVFFFYLPPLVFENGFSVTISGPLGEQTISTNKPVSVKRSRLSRMAPVEVRLVSDIKAPEAIDMGLPSGIKWGSFNLGGEKPEDYGCYYAWGEYRQKEGYSWDNYRWGGPNYSDITKYNKTDGLYVLDSIDDIAHVALGGEWRLPTDGEFSELLDDTNCSWQWISLNGINGYEITSKNNGNSIFLPAAGGYAFYGNNSFDIVYDEAGNYGLYWSSLLLPYSVGGSYALRFTTSIRGLSAPNRFVGLTIRPVYGNLVNAESISFSPPSLTISEHSYYKLSPHIYPEFASTKAIRWDSTNSSIVTVNCYGEIQSIQAGEADILASTVAGAASAACHIVVRDAEYPVPDIVDLGLPSGTLWASHNLGACCSEEVGVLFAWGETSPKDYYTYENYIGVYSEYRRTGLSALLAKDDAANAILGPSWFIPTKEQAEELIDDNYCTWTEATLNGVPGFTVTSKLNGNSLFFPFLEAYSLANGLWYWTSSLNTIFKEGAVIASSLEYDGRPIRPVYIPSITEKPSISFPSSIIVLNESELFEVMLLFEPAECSNRQFDLTSSSNIVSIDGNRITALAPGVATITATARDGGNKASCTLVVCRKDAVKPTVVDMDTDVLWLANNLGESTIEGSGPYYAWGEAETKSSYNWASFQGPTADWFTDCSALSWPHSADPAGLYYGDSFRIPSSQEMQNLFNQNKYIWTWTTHNGISGYEIKCLANGNTLFLPALGYKEGNELFSNGVLGLYWLSSMSSDGFNRFNGLTISASNYSMNNYYNYYGGGIRAVIDKAKYQPIVDFEVNTSSIVLHTGREIIQKPYILGFKPSSPPYPSNTTIAWEIMDKNVISLFRGKYLVAKTPGGTSIKATAIDNGMNKNIDITVLEADLSSVEAVDLGLPSGVKWSNCNLGSALPSALGDYYSWGDIHPYSGGDGVYGSFHNWQKYNTLPEYGIVDGKTTLDIEDDAASHILGESWRIPTKADFEELLNSNYTSFKSGYVGVVPGVFIVSKINGNSIFFPYAGWMSDVDHYPDQFSRGYYWTADLMGSDPDSAYYCEVSLYNSPLISFQVRSAGHSIRPICR